MQESIEKLVAECANLNVRLSKRLPENMHFLIWSSPTSVRNPEISIFWHPFYNKRKIFSRLFTYSFCLVSSFIRGLYKFFSYKGFYYYHIDNSSPVLLIIPEAITEGTDKFKTNYLTETAEQPVDKLIFSHSAKKMGLGLRWSTLDYLTKGTLFLKLLLIIFYDFKERLSCKKVTKEYVDALMIFVCWFLAQSWYFIWDFYYLINRFAVPNKYRYFLALHEMHFYSRVVWEVANEKGLLGITAQHGLIIPEKLWYFPDEFEVKENCPLPDVFFVYSDDIREALKPFYPKTKFFKSCSPRFKRWKSFLDVSIKDNARNNKPVILIANNAAILHDNVVLKALRRLVGQKMNNLYTLRLRLHPTERLKLMDQLWVTAAAILHRIELSSNSLLKDFNESDLVIGANSAVVQEALLMRVPVMGVFDECYIASSILPTSFNCNVERLTKDMLIRHIYLKPDEDVIHRFRTNIGVFSPDLTTKLIFEHCR